MTPLPSSVQRDDSRPTTALTAVAVASLTRSIQAIRSELKKVTERLERLERAIDKNTDAVKRTGR